MRKREGNVNELYSEPEKLSHIKYADETILITATTGEGRRLLKSCIRDGGLVVGARTLTPLALALEILADTTNAGNTHRLLSRGEQQDLVYQALTEAPTDGFFALEHVQERKTAELFLESIQELNREEIGPVSGNERLDALQRIREAYQATVADLEGNAHGPLWGTTLHRVMELCVKKNAFDAVSRKKYAERAFRETLESEELTSESRKLLDPLGRYGSEESLFRGVVEQAVEQTNFIEEGNHPLTDLLKEGRSYTELPFQFREENPDARIRELCADLIQPEDERCIEIHGIIDLAVKDGAEWTIIDYKTDALLLGESREQFEARLREQYSPQIMLYREILQRMGLGEVKAMYLCAIAMHGAMIRLDV